MYEDAKELISTANKILVIQADNPDADSLGSALALEQILGEMGKSVYLYCGVDIPSYLQYLKGWDRVLREVPSSFDSSIIVDTSAISLLQKLQDSGKQHLLASKPCVVLDHHGETKNDIPFATTVINDPQVSSTGELIFKISKTLGWKLDEHSAGQMMTAILGDTQGLTNNLARVETYRVMAELIQLGANRPRLEELRREASKMHPLIFAYKARLIERTEFQADGRIASVMIPQDEISEFSPLYNPAPLIQPDMLQTSGVCAAIVFKTYKDGKILCSIRCNQGSPIGAKLAEHFGGGGHDYASGFKIQDGRPFNEIKSECIGYATELLDKIQRDHKDETLQHTVA
ncbi:MAG TPA: DHH family phosphoesterase [Patescibacteria group bacterium]|nr:DHH family phosphoesterase [Patescibacteria group bacterium]